MSSLQTLYMMAFTPAKMDNNSLMGMCRAAANMLSAKDQAFAQRMGLLNNETRITFSNQLYSPIMHSPQVMQSTLGGWLKNENTPFDPKLGDNFFFMGLKDPAGADNFVLFYFDFK
jgi:hypothetical protein